MDMLYSNPASFTQKGGEVVISILLMIFAIGTQYAHLESSFRHSAQATDSNFAEEDIGTTFYQQAIRLLPEIIELSSLESVQACLLLGYYALPIDASGLGYIYINLGVRLAMQNGMHRKCKNSAFSPTMIETRNRVWWTVYSLERKISIFHGRPLSVLRADVDATIPLHQPSLDLGESYESVARAKASIQLINYLEDLFIEVNALRSGQKQQIPKVIKSLLARKMALKTWWNSLPEDILSDRIQDEVHHDGRSTLHLKLEYCLVRMFIGRPFLLKRETSNSIGVSPTDSDMSIPDNHPGKEIRKENYVTGRQSLVDDCIEAATEALQICQDLRDNRAGLARASYIEYSSCRASLLVLIAYSIQNFSEQFRKLLYNGLDMIREMSAAGESARSEVSLIEMLERALARLHTGSHSSQHSGSHLQPEASVSDYEAFKHWGAKIRGTPAIESPGTTTDGMAGQRRPTLPSEIFNTEEQVAGTDYVGMEPALGRDFDAGMLGAFDSVLEMSIFGPENPSPSAAWPTWTEAEVLEQFLTNPEFDGSPELMHT
ncbi:hypothetical protein N7478_005524 [Penicillium angulare]|uniref:uncharacterized protein n=1 Tax=Penicillium angulare TaxID=116970 RepID=UPI0025421AAD|nr:uncharacterized protein N7478_005524 [Penicillium angulare]KAJ5280152.1 hypothetical protein N7478_005524 [Penicillium angulare]